MNTKIYNWAWKKQGIVLQYKLVLLAIAYNLPEGVSEATVFFNDMVSYCAMSKKTLKAALSALKSLDLLDFEIELVEGKGNFVHLKMKGDSQ